MIIYGYRSAHLKSGVSQNVTCPSCGAKGSTTFSVFGRHAHVFWIPLFPLGKTGGSVCQNCNHTMKSSEMPEDIKKEYRYVKSEARPKIWQFSGLALIAILIAYGSFASNKDKEQEKEFLASPMAGDVYHYTTEDGEFSTLRVFEIIGDTIWIQPNDYVVNKRSGMNQLEGDENYSDMVYPFFQAELDSMYDTGNIFDIKR